jgi:hypothetical protein
MNRLRKNLQKKIPFTTASKNKRPSKKEVKALYNKNYKPLKKEIEEDIRRWNDVPCS